MVMRREAIKNNAPTTQVGTLEASIDTLFIYKPCPPHVMKTNAAYGNIVTVHTAQVTQGYKPAMDTDPFAVVVTASARMAKGGSHSLLVE
jgi:hypothetical protein